MKKSTKVLIVAASAVAVVGIGAVSFAKWSGGTTSKEVTGYTDSVSQLGFGSEQVITLSQKLLPFDQATTADDTSVTLSSSSYASVALTVSDDGKTYNVKAGYSSSKALSGDIYCKVAASAPTDEITLSTDGGAASLAAKGWVKLTADAATVEVDGSATWTTTPPTAYFLLVSDSTGDMNATLTVTLELDEVTA